MLASVSYYMIVFRIIHILSGVFWVGSALLVAFFIEPTAAKLGPAAGPFLEEMMEKRKAPVWITFFAMLTVTGGLFLYWRAWHDVGSFGAWIGTAPGKVLTAGAVSAIIGLLLGVWGIRPTINKMGALGKEMATGGGPPTPEQGAAMRVLQEKLRLFSRVDAVFLILAVLAMATAREWGPGL